MLSITRSKNGKKPKIRLDSMIEPILFEVLMKMDYKILIEHCKKEGYTEICQEVWEEKYKKDFNDFYTPPNTDWQSEYVKTVDKITTKLSKWLGGVYTDAENELLNITDIYIPSSNIKLIPDEIKYLNKLHTINLHNNDLTSFPIELCNVKLLKSLDLSNNKLSSTNFTIQCSISYLNHLDLSGNLLTELPNLHNLPHLKVLNAIGNNINQIKKLNDKLKNLDLSDNVIDKVNIKHDKLEYLNLRANKISEIMLDTPKLKCLNLLQNEISELKISHLKKLQELNISNNLFGKLPDLPKRLVILKASNNGITDIPKNLSKLTNLEYLELIGNNIESLPENFVNLVKLRELRASGNNISNFPEDIFTLPELEYIDLKRNPLKKLSQEEYTKDEIKKRGSREGSRVTK